ncbi:hypothetical protein [Reichenbachiella sp.]|uniref:hypothetical protein n=1 Tax=Reichenbachiella sp. TaxID=2184521 RepID=UPI003B5AE6BD
MGKRHVTDSERKMRGKIIHYLCQIGYTTKANKPDYTRINSFVQNIGSRNPRKVILNFLYANELNEVLNQVEQMYRKELKQLT